MIICDIGRRLKRDDMGPCEGQGNYHIVLDQGPPLDLCAEHWAVMKLALDDAGQGYDELLEPSPYSRSWQPLEDDS